MTTVAYQGHAGAFSDVAARELVPGAETRGYASFDAVAEAVDRGEVDCGILPVENAIAGSIPRNYELLWERDLHVAAETVLRINLCLIGPPGTTEATIAEIRSHPVALEQVRALADNASRLAPDRDDRYGRRGARGGRARRSDGGGDRSGPGRGDLRRHDRRPRSARRDGELHALLPRHPRRRGPPEARAHDAAAQEAGARRDRACVGIRIADKPGSLRDALSAFADRGLDLRFLIARPDRREAFRYRFFCESDQRR